MRRCICVRARMWACACVCARVADARSELRLRGACRRARTRCARAAAPARVCQHGGLGGAARRCTRRASRCAASTSQLPRLWHHGRMAVSPTAIGPPAMGHRRCPGGCCLLGWEGGWQSLARREAENGVVLGYPLGLPNKKAVEQPLSRTGQMTGDGNLGLRQRRWPIAGCDRRGHHCPDFCLDNS